MVMMKPIFPRTFKFKCSSLYTWQNVIIDRLSEHKRRVPFWEFSSTLFEYLCKQSGFDYKKLLQKNENHESLEEECKILLSNFGKIKIYWWWPWSKKIKDIRLTKEQLETAINYDQYSFLKRLILGMFTNVIIYQWHIVICGAIDNYQKLKVKKEIEKSEDTIKKSS